MWKLFYVVDENDRDRDNYPIVYNGESKTVCGKTIESTILELYKQLQRDGDLKLVLRNLAGLDNFKTKDYYKEIAITDCIEIKSRHFLKNLTEYPVFKKAIEHLLKKEKQKIEKKEKKKKEDIKRKELATLKRLKKKYENDKT